MKNHRDRATSEARAMRAKGASLQAIIAVCPVRLGDLIVICKAEGERAIQRTLRLTARGI